MAIYHFDVEDGQHFPDPIGADLPDLDAARDEALRRSVILLATRKKDFWQGHSWKMTVTDDEGHVQFALNFLAVSSPLTKEYGRRPSED
jgi:hypothetical protein